MNKDEWLPDMDAIRQAARRIEGEAVHTPVLESALLNQVLGCRVLLKAECLQRTGSFKFRGACNRIRALTPEERARGVVAYSSGNHAQGVAAAAQALGVSATIVIPRDAPVLKIDNTRGYGARVILYDRYTESREAIGQEIARQEGRILVPPYDDAAIIAGQGTVGLELAGELTHLGVMPDALFCPCGGGGLVAGVSLALQHLLPSVSVFAAEPEHFDDTRRSLLAGERVSNDSQQRSICDSIITPTPGELTFAINRRTLAGAVVVPETAIRAAMRLAFTHLKLVVEPGGVAGLAAVLDRLEDYRGKTVVVVLSGGNVDLETYIRLMGGD
ncbi:MAG: threonine/serine dehydratase [Thiothrix sp.]|nr:threonine/serine dehydratase [Thiothrix sp.]HPQ94355.1 threonine/serine dehydratase [Thiolinea sp.]